MEISKLIWKAKLELKKKQTELMELEPVKLSDPNRLNKIIISVLMEINYSNFFFLRYMDSLVQLNFFKLG